MARQLIGLDQSPWNRLPEDLLQYVLIGNPTFRFDQGFTTPYRRLQKLGEAITEFVLVNYLYTRNDLKAEVIHLLRDELRDPQFIAKRVEDLGIREYLNRPKATNEKLTNAYDELIGALYYFIFYNPDRLILLSNYIMSVWFPPQIINNIIADKLREKGRYTLTQAERIPRSMTEYVALPSKRELKLEEYYIASDLLKIIFYPQAIPDEIARSYGFYTSDTTKVFNRLEILGDAILAVIVEHYVAFTLPDDKMDNTRRVLISNDTIASVLEQSSFIDYIRWPKGQYEGQVKSPTDVFETFIAVLYNYVITDFDTLRNYILDKWLSPLIDDIQNIG